MILKLMEFKQARYSNQNNFSCYSLVILCCTGRDITAGSVSLVIRSQWIQL